MIADVGGFNRNSELDYNASYNLQCNNIYQLLSHAATRKLDKSSEVLPVTLSLNRTTESTTELIM